MVRNCLRNKILFSKKKSKKKKEEKKIGFKSGKYKRLILRNKKVNKRVLRKLQLYLILIRL